MDQGTTYLKIYELWQAKKFTLIGPESSIKTINGLSFFHGPWIYYFLLPFLLITNWSPFAGAYAFIFLNLFSLIIFYKTINKYLGFPTALISSIFFILDITSIRFSQFAWNPNLLLFVSIILILLFFKISQKPKNLLFLFIGLVFGLGLGSHYQIFILLFLFLFYFIYKKFSIPNFLFLLIGILVGSTPLIIFELKHQFYNSKIIYLIFTKGVESTIAQPIPIYYFLFFLPFLFLSTGILLNKINRNRPRLATLIIFFYCFYSLLKIFQTTDSGYTMPGGWNLKGYESASRIIIKENISNFNIVNLLSGDTRDYPLRFLLTSSNLFPLAIDQYPNAQFLYVISREGNSIINNSVWEISSFKPAKIIKSWHIQNNISLYLLEKSSL